MVMLICKIFPKRFNSSPNWGSGFPGVTCNSNNFYTGLANYSSTNANYAPFGRQFWCYNIQGTQVCNVKGDTNRCLFQFPNPTGTSNYCASISIRCLDSSIVQTNTITSANCGVKMYIDFQV